VQLVGVKFRVELLRPVFADEAVQLVWKAVAIQVHPRAGYFLDPEGAMKDMDGECRVRGRGRVWQ